MSSGLLIINKPKDMTSRDVVNTVSKKLGIKHIGHTGTLDPIATGVLVLAVNEGCKIIELLTSEDKEYIAEVLVGVETDTLDSTGNILNTYNIENLTNDEVMDVLNSFIGKYEQEVPKYSAVHVNGKRLYEYARSNTPVILPKREVEIKGIELINYLEKEGDFYKFSFRVRVSKGTYIRSLIRDIGIRLNIPCTMNNLIRTKQGEFNIDESISLEEVAIDKLISIKTALNSYDKLMVDDDTAKRIKNGIILNSKVDNKYLLILDKNEKLLAIYEPYIKDLLKSKPYRVFGGMNNEKVK